MLTNRNYHDDTSYLSNSAIKQLLRSPAHYYESFLSPERKSFDNNAFQLGRAFHCALSEPELFFDRYIIAPGGIDRRTRDGKEKYAAFEDVAMGKVVLPEKPVTYHDNSKSKTLSYEQIMRMRDAVMSHPIAQQLLLSGRAETVYTWNDARTDTPCKCMTDWEPEAGNFIVDFKSTQDASPDGFSRSIRKYGYDRQDAFYTDGVETATGMTKTFIFIACETQAPYVVELYALSPKTLDNARESIKLALDLYNNCKRSGVWHTYNETRKIKILDL